MASSKDFEKIWESYQETVKTRSVSIVDYCQRNGIVYAQSKNFKAASSLIAEVQLIVHK